MKQENIYIVLTGTGTLFSQTIKWFTKAPLNHASLSFDEDLKEVYSFGRKKVNNPFLSGFVQENFQDPFLHQARCAVYRCKVGSGNYARMHQYVSEMRKNPERYKYHLLGLIGILIHLRIPRQDAYFCSHFVASVLEQSSFRPLDKPAHFVTPEDFALSLSSNEIYRGTVSGYMNQLPKEQQRTLTA
jgi:hypothetical protein